MTNFVDDAIKYYSNLITNSGPYFVAETEVDCLE